MFNPIIAFDFSVFFLLQNFLTKVFYYENEPNYNIAHISFFFDYNIVTLKKFLIKTFYFKKICKLLSSGHFFFRKSAYHSICLLSFVIISTIPFENSTQLQLLHFSPFFLLQHSHLKNQQTLRNFSVFFLLQH